MSSEGTDVSGVVWFVDRSLGKSVASALRQAGETVIYKDERYADDTADVVWLADAGLAGWYVLTKDRYIRQRRAEREVLLRAGVRAFFLSSGNLRGAEQVERIVGSLDRMKRFAAERDPPFLASVTKNGVNELPT